MERTLVLLKPDTVQRRLVGRILGRFEERGLRIVALKMMSVSRELAERHYGEHREKPFFGELVSFITAGPIVALAIEGPRAVTTVRAMMGKTNPLESAPGTIRGDFGVAVTTNLVHGSDSLESAERELTLFFSPGEILTYETADAAWLGG